MALVEVEIYELFQWIFAALLFDHNPIISTKYIYLDYHLFKKNSLFGKFSSSINIVRLLKSTVSL